MDHLVMSTKYHINGTAFNYSVIARLSTSINTP